MAQRIISIALCDDDRDFLLILREKIRERLRTRQISSSEVLFDNARALLEGFREGEHFDLYILDIDMPGIDGMEAARTIRRKDPEAVLVFVSSLEEMVYESFRVRPLSFIRKSRLDEDLDRLSDLFPQGESARKTQESACFIQDESGRSYRLSLSDTLYLEASDKYVKVVSQAEGKDYLVRSTISDMAKMLSGQGFVRTHRSFLVNLRKIYSIGRDSVLLDNGKSLPLARNRAEEVRKRFCLDM